jgi:PEP-CTERM motif
VSKCEIILESFGLNKLARRDGMTLRKLVAAALILAGTAAQAQLIFSDNFDTNPTGLNSTPADWFIFNDGTVGTVDIIGDNALLFDLIPGNGNYIDLDGTSGDAGVLSRSFSLIGGVEYEATFKLAGNHRTDAAETVRVTFGTTFEDYAFAQADPFASRSLRFTPTFDDSYPIRFANSEGRDNIGMLLDDVRVYAVPEPQTYALLLAGFAAACFVARRRRRYEP